MIFTMKQASSVLFNAKELADLVSRFDKSPPPNITKIELTQFIVVLINATIYKCKKNNERLHDRELAKEFLCNEKSLDTLLSTIELVGTHNLKCPNASVSQGAAVDLDLEHKAVATIPYVHSISTHTARLVSGAGNASNAGYIRLLAQEFCVDGALLSLVQCFAQGVEPVVSILKTLGLEEHWCEKLQLKAQQYWSQSKDSRPVDRFAKQVFWPIRDGDGFQDILITPVVPFGFTRELHHRLNERRFSNKKEDGKAVEKEQKKNQYFTVLDVKIGGSNPINTGPFSSEIGGKYKHFIANMPMPVSSGQQSKLWFQLTCCKDSIFELSRRKPLDASALMNPGSKDMPDRHRRAYHRQSAINLVSQLFHRILKVKEALHQLPVDEHIQKLSHLPDDEQAWLLETLAKNKLLSVKEKADQVMQEARYINGKEAAVLGDSDRKIMNHALNEWWEAN
ncbi:hypothetical protein H0A36_17725 [Endozoicomonas sp. SM1973]|uniref:Uncharacterized protein n=2 Tax=Spartinivicinus marinus TaxID=2994442 RepID=A0A853IEC6_9GAMM|nr:type I-F CRISPR-associated protein Csy1 [Spartinivicinus marinus]MCX4030214.1 hypothetical protein [Spartinivicinus marinus]NYZ67857.1 hypothetical protein [Spartinivicinus marinus]